MMIKVIIKVINYVIKVINYKGNYVIKVQPWGYLGCRVDLLHWWVLPGRNSGPFIN